MCARDHPFTADLVSGNRLLLEPETFALQLWTLIAHGRRGTSFAGGQGLVLLPDLGCFVDSFTK